MKRPKPRRLDYNTRILIALQSLQLSPGITPIRVMHDSWCPARNGKPPCRCVPTITLTASSGKIEVLADGTCRHADAMN